MTVVGNLILVCGRSGATRARGGLFGEDIRKGEGRLFGFTLEGYPGVIFLALIKVTLKSNTYSAARLSFNGSVESSSASFSSISSTVGCLEGLRLDEASACTES
jgi:hypothetical protein